MHNRRGKAEQEQELKARFKMKFAKTSVDMFQRVDMDIDDFSSVYGWFAGILNEAETYISVSYVFHILNFKVARNKILGIFDGSSVKFNVKQIDAIKTNFCKYQALKALKGRGQITNINFEE